MSQALEQAQKGDPKAIAALMNRHLTPQGVAVQVAMFGDTIQVLLDGIDVPNQPQMTTFVTTGLQKLGTPEMANLQIFGKRTGETEATWVAAFAKQEDVWTPIEAVDGAAFGAGDRKLLARQGNTEAIAQFVDAAIQELMADTGDRVTEEATDATPIESFVHLDENGLLNVTIQTTQFLDGPAFAAQFGTKMNAIASNAVREVALYKRKTAEASPFLIKQMTLHRAK
jgi:hypothetical protein